MYQTLAYRENSNVATHADLSPIYSAPWMGAVTLQDPNVLPIPSRVAPATAERYMVDPHQDWYGPFITKYAGLRNYR